MNIVSRLKELTMPVLIIHGAQDEIVPLRLSKRLHKDLPKSKLIIIDKCGHVPQEECPEQTVKEIKKFLDTL